MQQIISGGSSSEVVDGDPHAHGAAEDTEKKVSIREALGHPKITFVLGN